MLALSPRQVPSELSLWAVLARAPGASPLGVWLRSRRPFTLIMVRARRRHTLIVDGDLGRLLHCCASIVVQLGSEVVTASPEELSRARALRVVAGSPALPTPNAIRALFSGARGVPSGLEIPLAQRSAEEVLAACAAVGVPVLSSRIVYGRIRKG